MASIIMDWGDFKTSSSRVVKGTPSFMSNEKTKRLPSIWAANFNSLMLSIVSNPATTLKTFRLTKY